MITNATDNTSGIPAALQLGSYSISIPPNTSNQNVKFLRDRFKTANDKFAAIQKTGETWVHSHQAAFDDGSTWSRPRYVWSITESPQTLANDVSAIANELQMSQALSLDDPFKTTLEESVRVLTFMAGQMQLEANSAQSRLETYRNTLSINQSVTATPVATKSWRSIILCHHD